MSEAPFLEAKGRCKEANTFSNETISGIYFKSKTV